jgi:hypothetical protein
MSLYITMGSETFGFHHGVDIAAKMVADVFLKDAHAFNCEIEVDGDEYTLIWPDWGPCHGERPTTIKGVLALILIREFLGRNGIDGMS